MMSEPNLVRAFAGSVDGCRGSTGVVLCTSCRTYLKGLTSTSETPRKVELFCKVQHHVPTQSKPSQVWSGETGVPWLIFGRRTSWCPSLTFVCRFLRVQRCLVPMSKEKPTLQEHRHPGCWSQRARVRIQPTQPVQQFRVGQVL